MAFGWNRTRYTPIAVDFGAHSLKLLQIVPGDPPHLLAAGAMTAPTDCQDRWGFYSDALRQLCKQLPFKGHDAVCTTPAHQTLIQHLQISGGEQTDLSEAVGQELRQRLSIDPSRMVVRHFHVGQFVRDGSPRQEVVCVATGRDTVMRYIQALKQAGFETSGIFAEPQAVVRSFAHLYRRHDDDQRTTCFIDLGAATVKVVIAHGTEMVFAKTIHHVSHAAAPDSTDPAEAAEPAEPAAEAPADMPAIPPHGPPIDLETGAGDGGSTSPENDAGPRRRSGGAQALARAGLAVLDAPAPPEPVARREAPARAEPKARGEVTDNAMDCLLDELQLCLRYHQGMFPERAVEQLVFLGGGSRLVERCQRIAQGLRIAAQLGDPLARLVRPGGAVAPVGLDMRQPQPGWAVPMGLCLSQT